MVIKMAKCFDKRKKGSIMIWQLFEIILFMALVYTFITLWPVFLQKQNVDYIAKTMVRAVETNGRIDSSITDLQHELENDFGVELDDVSTAIKLTEREMEVIRREEKNRKILALPDKVRMAIVATGAMVAIVAMTPIIMDMIKGISMFK